jgi:hypothetical protein
MHVLMDISFQVAKKIVRGDFKSGRVKDPNASVSSKHEKTIKSMVKDFMDKAVKKKQERDKGKAARAASRAHSTTTATAAEEKSPETPLTVGKEEANDVMSEIEGFESSEESPTSDLKRKREEDGQPSSPKKSRIEIPHAPPPPPPPPTEDVSLDTTEASPTPMEEQDGLVNSLAVKLPQDHVTIACHLATPPTNGTTEHEEYSKSDQNSKRSWAVRGPA